MESPIGMGVDFSLIDTGGYVVGSDDIFEKEIDKQVKLAIEEADAIFLWLRSQTGLTGMDEEVAQLLRRSKKPVFLAVNKVDNAMRQDGAVEFYSLGFDKIYPMSGNQWWWIWRIIGRFSKSTSRRNRVK